jgi:hypothetical protein
MIQDGWIKMKVLSIVIEWSIVDNLVTSENKGNFVEFFFKKNSHNLRHIIQYLILVKKWLRFHDIIIWGCYRFSNDIQHFLGNEIISDVFFATTEDVLFGYFKKSSHLNNNNKNQACASLLIGVRGLLDPCAWSFFCLCFPF